MSTAVHETTANTDEPMTAQSLLAQHRHQRSELVRGELRMMSPAGSEHGWIVARLTIRIGMFVEQSGSGHVFGAETGFLIERDPDTVRAPDVAFVSADRIEGRPPAQFFPGPPDLAVEVLSPSDTASEVQEKAEDWMNAGCREVWLIDPRRQSATRLTPEITPESSKNSGTPGGRILQQRVAILETDLLPGFSLKAAEVFKASSE